MEADVIKAQELINTLESKGEISINDGHDTIFIQSVDDKEGYSYVSSTNKEFKSSREAVEWILKKQIKLIN